MKHKDKRKSIPMDISPSEMYNCLLLSGWILLINHSRGLLPREKNITLVYT